MNQLKKCIVIPDSFKGTLSSIEVCDTIRAGIEALVPDCQVLSIPVADGGEGTADCFLHALSGAEKMEMTASGPFGEPVSCYYVKAGSTAVVEMAQTAGLPLAEGHLDPRHAGTYGVGEMIAHAVRSGCTEIIIGLGGSCTNDAGVGCAMALGVEFYDSEGNLFAPDAVTLSQIASFRVEKARQLLENCHITAMCDIDNPMYGPQGAAYVFAPQKGADEACVKELDDNLRALAQVFEKCPDENAGMYVGSTVSEGATKDMPENIAGMKGAGAAGAMGAGIVAFLGGRLKSGIDTVLDLVGFDKELADADLVFTGEGKIDAQSLGGKAVIGISRRAKAQNVPVIAVVGAIGEGAEGAYEEGVQAVFSINTSAIDYEIARYHSRENLSVTIHNILRALMI